MSAVFSDYILYGYADQEYYNKILRSLCVPKLGHYSCNLISLILLHSWTINTSLWIFMLFPVPCEAMIGVVFSKKKKKRHDS